MSILKKAYLWFRMIFWRKRPPALPATWPTKLGVYAGYTAYDDYVSYIVFVFGQERVRYRVYDAYDGGEQTVLPTLMGFVPLTTVNTFTGAIRLRKFKDDAKAFGEPSLCRP